MIEGVVNAAHEAVVTLALHGSAGQTRDIEAVIDTGFTGFLTVPPALAGELGLDSGARAGRPWPMAVRSLFPHTAWPYCGTVRRDT